MLFPALLGLIIGLMIPAIAGRFGKILPADPGQVILMMGRKPHFPKGNNRIRRRRFIRLWLKLIFFSILWGGIISALFVLINRFLPGSVAIWGYFFVSLICFCIVTDLKYCLLPDFFTVPLLVLGFAAATFSPLLGPADSVFGAGFGYLISLLSTMLLGRKHKGELGLGDIKMMVAMGAWLGVMGFNFALMLSFFFFALYATVRGKKQDAYGPALGIAALITFFLIYAG